jgi:hypothetical protein
MFKPLNVGIVSVLLAVMTLPSASSQHESKPVIDREVFVSYIPPNLTIAEMVARADAVVVARYVAGAGEYYYVGNSRAARTEHPFEVVDTIRPHHLLPQFGGTFTVELMGGCKEFPTHIDRVVVRGTRNPIVGRTYIVFLRWNDERRRFELPWSVYSIYDVSSTRVGSLLQNERIHRGRPVSEFLSELGLFHGLPGVR